MSRSIMHVGAGRASDLQRAVLDELAWDARVDAADIGVEVDHGVVTLTGTVDSYAKKHAAQQAAHRLAGVRDVANDIVVRPVGSKGRTDTEIAQAVRHALEWNALVPADRIRSTVEQGEVKLEGSVDSWTEREEAARAIRSLAGVRAVINELSVTPEWVEAEIVRGSIEDALRRQVEREADRIHVSVRDGIVHLSGTVRTWAERRAIVGAASHAPGIRDFVDDLVVDPSV